MLIKSNYPHGLRPDLTCLNPCKAMPIMGWPNLQGMIPIRQDISVLPADDPSTLRIGWRIQEEIGIVVINDYALARINLNSG